MANLQKREYYRDAILGDEDGLIFAVFEEDYRTHNQEMLINE